MRHALRPVVKMEPPELAVLNRAHPRAPRNGRAQQNVDPVRHERTRDEVELAERAHGLHARHSLLRQLYGLVVDQHRPLVEAQGIRYGVADVEDETRLARIEVRMETIVRAVCVRQHAKLGEWAAGGARR